ncbi:putative sugar kinase [Escherichia coli]|uniref:Putative sugar kinase n=1 Tax=Escherichia coli TaxID=562 RepID=A0A484YYE6_ECOLX|nr:putative sugar kinase [Escherichia coli]
MSKKYIIGIDGGSQSTKVVMYDLEGNVVCEGKGLLQPMHTPDADTAEHPDDDLWASLCFAGHDLMSQFAGIKKILSALAWDPSVAAVRY